MMLLNLLKSPHEDIDFLKQVRVSFKGYCHEILVKREKPKDIFSSVKTYKQCNEPVSYKSGL